MSQQKAQVDKLLTNVSNAYMPTGLVAENILPVLEVAQDSGILAGYGAAHLRIENSVKSGRGKARYVEPIVRKTDNTYLIQKHELQGMVTEDDYRNVELPFDAEKDETTGLTSILVLEKEKILADALSSTGVMTSNVTLAGTSQFSDYTNSDPIAAFKTAQNAILAACGLEGDTAVIPRLVFNTLKYHPKILSSLGYSLNRAGTLKEAELAEVLGVKKLWVPQAAYNSAKEGQADTLAQVWGKNIQLLVSPDKAEKYQTSFGYYMKRSGIAPRRVKKWNVEDSFGDTGILVGDYYQFRITNVNAGYLIKDAIA
jgi:hypothetical protein